jgi:hypothetical protein
MGCTYRACLPTTHWASPELFSHLAKSSRRSTSVWPQPHFFGRPDRRWQRAEGNATSIRRKCKNLTYSCHSSHLFGGRGFVAGGLKFSGTLMACPSSRHPTFSRRPIQLAAFYGVLLSSVTAGAGTAGISSLVREAAVASEGSLVSLTHSSTF